MYIEPNCPPVPLFQLLNMNYPFMASSSFFSPFISSLIVVSAALNAHECGPSTGTCLPAATPQNRNDSPFSSSPQLPVGLQLGIGPYEPFPYPCRNFDCLILYISCAGEFMSTTAMSCPWLSRAFHLPI